MGVVSGTVLVVDIEASLVLVVAEIVVVVATTVLVVVFKLVVVTGAVVVVGGSVVTVLVGVDGSLVVVFVGPVVVILGVVVVVDGVLPSFQHKIAWLLLCPDGCEYPTPGIGFSTSKFWLSPDAAFNTSFHHVRPASGSGTMYGVAAGSTFSPSVPHQKV